MKIIIESKKYGVHIIPIDKNDFVKIKPYKWRICLNRNTFVVRGTIKIKNIYKNIYMHRLILMLDKNKIIDHINGNGLDNRRRNLRICLIEENNRNRRLRIDSSTNYKGVYYIKKYNLFQARIGLNNKKISLGCYKSSRLAYKAYCKAAKRYHGDFARLK